jgi:hypothetical protein
LFNKIPTQPKHIFLYSFLVFFFLMGLWSLATPLMSSPDESVQVAKAASEVRGQITGHLIGNKKSPYGIVKVPGTYANINNVTSCYGTNASQSAACAPKYAVSDKTVKDTIYIARYQPFYYFIVGLPSLLTDSVKGIYVMRFLSAFMSSVFIGLAVYSVFKWSRSRVLLAGILLAATPTAIFFGGMVNPVGFEASSSICFLVSLILIAQRNFKKVPLGLILITVISTSAEAVSRSVSPLWILLALLAALSFTSREHIGQLLEDTRIKIGAIIAIVVNVIALCWIRLMHSTNVAADGAKVAKNSGYFKILKQSLHRIPTYYKEVVSFFGFLNAPSPEHVYILWSLLLLGLSGLAFYYGTRKNRIVLSVCIIAYFAIPSLISTSQAKRLGLVWQGSDSLPLYGLIPLVSSNIIANSKFAAKTVGHLRQRYIVIATASLTALSGLIAYFFELRRYSVGNKGPIFKIFKSGWHPPIGIAELVILEIIGSGLLISLMVLITHQKQAPAHTK